MDACGQKEAVWLCAASSWEKYADETDFRMDSGKDSELQVLAARNAYECAQILVCAAKSSQSAWDVCLSDLIAEDGTVYAKDNIAVFAEKYIEIDRNWHTNGLPTGSYPDALIPLKNAKEYGEAVIPAGKNRGIWLEFFVPKEQAAGIYRGEITVEADGIHTMPLRLEVLEITVPDETGTKSLFHTNFEHMSHYEKGDMHAMYDTYLHYLMKHRISQTEILHIGHSDEEIALFCEKAAQLCREEMSTIGIPSVEKELDGYKTYSDEYLMKYLYALAEKSVNCGINILERAAFYDWHIDEPFMGQYAPGQVSSSIERFQSCVHTVLAKCKGESAFSTKLGKEVLSSLEGVSQIVTDQLYSAVAPASEKRDASGEVFEYDCTKVALCPRYEAYETKALAELYQKSKEKWWYGCNVPGAPFISYHIDDAAYSPRIVGWLMARFGITGNLYWANNICTEINTTGSPLFLDDPYGTAHRGFGANGDGAILYPGSVYGVEGPVGSIRLKAVREGNQDFELLRAANRRYEEMGASFWSIFDRITAAVCDGTKIDSMKDSFGRVREALMRLCEGVCSPLELVVEAERRESGIAFRIRTSRDAELYVDGKRMEPEDRGWSFYKEYAPDAWFELEIHSEGKMLSIPLYRGRGLEITIHETLFQRGAVQAEKGTVSLNPDGVRREITVDLEEPGRIHIDLGCRVSEGEGLGFELKTREPCTCTVFADGYEEQGKQIRTIERWNRIEIATDFECFAAGGINICFEEPKKVGIGAVYIHR